MYNLDEKNDKLIAEENSIRVSKHKTTGILALLAFITIVLFLVYLVSTGFTELNWIIGLSLFSVFCLLFAIDEMTLKTIKIYPNNIFIPRGIEGFPLMDIFHKSRNIEFENIKKVRLNHKVLKDGSKYKEIVIKTNNGEVILTDWYYDKAFFDRMIEIFNECNKLKIDNSRQ